MNTQPEQEKDFKEKLQETIEQLEKQFQPQNLNYDDFKSAYEALKKAQSKLQELLQYASEVKKDEKKFYELYKRLSGENASDLIDRLRGQGHSYRKNKAFKEAFENQGYRLLEQTRAGKRQDVFYGTLRIFISLKRKFPKRLTEPFKPVYSDEMFKVLMFSFLSGILGKESEDQ